MVALVFLFSMYVLCLVLSKAELIQIVKKKRANIEIKLFFIFCKIFYFIVCLNFLESIFFLMMLVSVL